MAFCDERYQRSDKRTKLPQWIQDRIGSKLVHRPRYSAANAFSLVTC
jgi:Rad3-related DNA helicase